LILAFVFINQQFYSNFLDGIFVELNPLPLQKLSARGALDFDLDFAIGPRPPDNGQ